MMVTLQKFKEIQYKEIKMKAKTLLTLSITVIVVSSLFGCSTTTSGPGPKESIGQQGDVGPSSENAIHIESTDVLVKIEYPLSGFSEIVVSDFFEVEIRQGDTYHVMVEAEETIAPYHDIAVRGKTLHIGLDPNYVYNIESTGQRVEVTVPVLTRVHVSNHGTLVLEDFETKDSLSVSVTDFGTLKGSITAGNVNMKVTNHGELILSGSASQVMGEVWNFSSADLMNLEAAELDIDTDSHSSLDK
jgi:hypothetical protein